YASLGRLLELPDGVEVFPGHVAGSLCGAAMSSKASTTIGFERRFNPMLAGRGEEDFVSASALTRSPRPPNLERIVELNRGRFLGAPERVAEPDQPAPPPLDVRPADVFAAGHATGAINVPLERRGFATKSAFVLLEGERPLIHA